MEYLVTMTTRVPDGMPAATVDDVRAREAEHSRQLAAEGHLLRLWRPPLEPGAWRTLGLFAAPDTDALEVVLASMPLRMWRSDKVTPLASHPNDPARWMAPLARAQGGGAEFLTTFTVAPPPGTPWSVVDTAYGREAQRARELAEERHLLRLWTLADHGPLGLWWAHDRTELDRVLASLPVAPWMAVETVQLTAHPSDPGIMQSAAAAPHDNGRKVVIVTGASQGIGEGIAAAYRQLGWAVVATALTIKPSEDQDMLTIEGDLSRPETAARVVDEALAAFGHVDTLVNDAGVYISKPFTDYTEEDYASVVGVNLTGFFALTQLVVRQMLHRHRGHVVNMAATLAEYAESATPAVLAALTKGGVAAATRSLAIEYASRGIRVNAISPGVVETPLHSPSTYDAAAARTPLGRAGQVGDVVRAVMFLESSPFITGETVHVDGGRSAGH